MHVDHQAHRSEKEDKDAGQRRPSNRCRNIVSLHALMNGSQFWLSSSLCTFEIRPNGVLKRSNLGVKIKASRATRGDHHVCGVLVEIIFDLGALSNATSNCKTKITIWICTARYMNRWIWVFRFRLVEQNLTTIQDFDLHFTIIPTGGPMDSKWKCVNPTVGCGIW